MRFIEKAHVSIYSSDISLLTQQILFHLKAEIASENYQIRHIGEWVAMIQSLQTWCYLCSTQSG